MSVKRERLLQAYEGKNSSNGRRYKHQMMLRRRVDDKARDRGDYGSSGNASMLCPVPE